MVASNRESAIKQTLKYEGGYTNNPADPGGPTNWGITIADARKYWKPSATAADVKAMPQSVAVEIYRKRYWDAVGGDELPAGLDFAVFDFGVNSGVSRALTYLKATKGDTEKRIVDLCDARLIFLKKLKTWPAFGKGWGKRVADVKAAALKMARGSVVPFPKPPDVEPPPEPEPKPAESIPWYKRLRNWIGGTILGGSLGGGGLATGWDWHLFSVVAGAVVLVALILFGIALWLFGKEHVAGWVKRQLP
jgi:lysozyme family protein